LDPDGDGLFNTSEMDELDKFFPPPGPHPVREYGDGSLRTDRTHWKREGGAVLLESKLLENYAPASAASAFSTDMKTGKTTPVGFHPVWSRTR
jgi:hypothetical protein